MDHVQAVTLFLLLLIAAVSALSLVLPVPYPIMMVIGGSLVGFVPGMPSFEIEPDLVLFVLLPPLLYNAAYSSSVRDLRRYARVISLNAIGLVLVTAAVVAVVAHVLVPGLPWAAALALGAVVSPTDPLAATQIARRFGLPQRIIVVIEGESLINDGAALVLLQSAVGVAGGAAFVWWQVGGRLGVAVVIGVAVGLLVGYLGNVVTGHARDDDTLRVTLSLVAAYLAYVPADALSGSGVIASVVAGLVMGHRAPVVTTSGSRLRSGAFWEVLVFLVNAVLFASVGLELPLVLESQSRALGTLLGLGLLVAAVVVVTRFAWSNVVVVLIRTLDRREAQRQLRSTWQLRIIGNWCGMRGAVSLAAVLALPRTFPERDLLTFLTLVVIWVTLVGQGLTLPALIRRLRAEDDGVAAREELHARKAATRAALEEIDLLEEEDWARADTLERLRGMYEFRWRRLLQRAGHAQDGDEDVESRSRDYQRVVRRLLEAQHRAIVDLRDRGDVGNDALRVVEHELDLEEQRLDS
jgi:monovalent cation/hydrogen antiporter